MTVKDVMTTEVITVSPDTTWIEAVKLMLDKHLSSAIVMNAEKEVVGILGEKDLFRGLYPSYRAWARNPVEYLSFDKLEENVGEATHRKVETLMSKEIISAEESDHVLKVGGQMAATGIHHVPVLRDGKLVGMIGRGDIYRSVLKEQLGLEA